MRRELSKHWKVLGLVAAFGAAPMAFAGHPGAHPEGKGEAAVHKDADRQVVGQKGDPQAMVHFVSKLHYANQAEIQFGHLAQEQGKSQEVKQYGDMLVKDHQQADDELLQLAKDEKIDLEPVKLAAKPENRKPIDELNRLREKQGAAFDQAFLTAMVKEHEKALGLLHGGLKQFQGTKLGDLVQKVVPTIEHHRDQARDLLKQNKPAAARRAPSNR